ncbi:hypothetical protein T4A_2992 [Trichinella pseudospiralis]|uniref:Uncharacterized protein n=1 Tax=Trichinella pseudospiralis TaxID=6337 RepID=A0A0V1DNF6_TRIPS|nr:hypothetical protein T4A_238 [Trichinella pseudospiralis]KRY62955.1 hypothetical protein T4A_2992 [Trichinella pseudospiralis]
MPALMSLKFHYNQFTGEYSERRAIFQERRVSVENEIIEPSECFLYKRHCD